MPSAAVRFFCVSHPPPTIVEPRKVNIFEELLNKNAARSRKHRFAVWWRCWSDGPFAALRALLRSSKQILINEMLNNKRMAKPSPKTKTTITPSRNAHSVSILLSGNIVATLGVFYVVLVGIGSGPLKGRQFSAIRVDFICEWRHLLCLPLNTNWYINWIYYGYAKCFRIWVVCQS